MKKLDTQEKLLFLCFQEKSDSSVPFRSQICKTKQKLSASLTNKKNLTKTTLHSFRSKIAKVTLGSLLFFSSSKEISDMK